MVNRLKVYYAMIYKQAFYVISLLHGARLRNACTYQLNFYYLRSTDYMYSDRTLLITIGMLFVA